MGKGSNLVFSQVIGLLLRKSTMTAWRGIETDRPEFRSGW